MNTIKSAAKLISENHLNLIFFIGLIGLIGSLYISNVVLLLPCELCWYQRVLMYPIPLIAAIGMWQKDKIAHMYIGVLSILGALVAGYQYLMQLGVLQNIPGCSLDNPCSNIQVQLLGFITIPLMSFAAFIAILVIVAIHQWQLRQQ